MYRISRFLCFKNQETFARRFCLIIIKKKEKGEKTMDLEKLKKNVTARGLEFFYAATAEEAKQHLLEQVQNTTVGIGGTKTVDQLGLYEELCKTNEVHWHWKDGVHPEVYRAAEDAEVYLSSVNGIAETGELVNIDGRGNRVAALSFAEGKRVFLLASTKKVCPDLSSAMERARTVAAPANVPKMPGNRPCNTTGQSWDCRSPARGCCVMQIIMFRPMNAKQYELILIDEDLGF